MLSYSLEAPRRGASNEYTTYVFVEKLENYQNFSVEKSFWLKKNCLIRSFGPQGCKGSYGLCLVCI